MGNPKPISLGCPSFFKVMVDDFSSTVRIPSHFVRHLRESITKRSVIIRSSGGRQWRIKMGIVGGQLYFQDGWERFISTNSITQGGFLVFFYDGDFGFDVIIYGATCCEKECVEDSDDEESCLTNRS